MPRLVDGHLIDPALVRLAEVDRHALHAGRQHQERDVQARREQGRGSILVDDRLDPAVLAGRGLDDGDAAAADGDDDVAGIDQGTDRFALHDPQRLGRGDDPAVAAPGVLDHRPAIPLGLLVGLLLGVERSDRLGGPIEGRIVGVDHDVRQDAGHAIGKPPGRQLVEERLAEDVADPAL